MAQRTVNTASGKVILDYIGRIERIREDKKALQADEQQVFAEVKAAGYSVTTLRNVLRRREADPHKVEEAQAELDMYLHAIGMAKDAPLFRAVGLMSVDTAARDQVIDAVKLLVPNNGEFILKIGGNPVRVWRDEEGNAHAEDWKEPKRRGSGGGAPRGARPPSATQLDVPECSADEAEQLGRDAYVAGKPIIKNPFPWGDERRARWDRGWRLESGGDGMGPDDDDGED